MVKKPVEPEQSDLAQTLIQAVKEADNAMKNVYKCLHELKKIAEKFKKEK